MSDTVIPFPVPLLGSFSLDTARTAFFFTVAVLLGLGVAWRQAAESATVPRAAQWLLVSFVVPGLELPRLLGVAIPTTFLEPLLLAAASGAAAEEIGRGVARRQLSGPPERRLPWALGVGVLAAAAACWWYAQGLGAWQNYLLGYHDFGHFARRVVNTWCGRGLLMETPSLPAFWDHFNPGLVLLAPLWGAWPDARLFLAIQAVCLALPAPLVYGIARRWGADRPAAALWGATYLAFPAVGQLNLNYTYGWHPVSLALPLGFAAIWTLLGRRYGAAALLAALACSFKENVPVVLAALAAMMAWTAWRRKRSSGGAHRNLGPLADALPWWGWSGVAAGLAAAFLLICQLAAFSRFQESQFHALGTSTWQIILSPVLRPEAFWGQLFRVRCGYFLLALGVPLGLRNLGRGWPILAAVALPLGVLLVWEKIAATSIAMQYTTTLIPLLFTAAIAGAADSGAHDETSNDRGPSHAGRFHPGALGAFAAALTLSIALGALPLSGPTLTGAFLRSYATADGRRPAAGGTLSPERRRLLDRIVRQVGSGDARVLATGRIASHLLDVARLEDVAQGRIRWRAFRQEVGPGHSPIELFDWIVLDTCEQFQQSPADVRFLAAEARRVGYVEVLSQAGVLVFARPDTHRPLE